MLVFLVYQQVFVLVFLVSQLVLMLVFSASQQVFCAGVFGFQLVLVLVFSFQQVSCAKAFGFSAGFGAEVFSVSQLVWCWLGVGFGCYTPSFPTQ